MDLEAELTAIAEKAKSRLACPQPNGESENS